MSDTSIDVRVREHFQQIYQRADRIIEIGLGCYFVFGLGIAWFYNTWMIALTVGTLTISMYAVAKWFFPKKVLNQHIAGCAFAIFMAQFIYQMHGLFEMHFFAFIGVIMLIVYQNWKAFIPITLLIIIHHSTFAYLQYTGYEEVYFTQLDYMSLSTFFFHVGLTGVIISLCAFWAYDFHLHTRKAQLSSIKVQDQLVYSEQNMAFAAEIAKGNLDVKQNREETNELGRSLIDMQQKLKDAKQREQRERFMNVGLAEVGDILRKNANSPEDLSEKVLAYLVKYVEANQGAVFIAEHDQERNEQVLRMATCYAYEKKKFEDKVVRLGQGLVGQTFLEKKTTHLTKVPQDYVNITSGLGEATPGHLLIVPLIVNENVEGIIELASFKDFPSDTIQFLEKVGESIASVIASSQASLRTARLLEETKTSEEELRAAEEEMRQNNEELQAIQEEISRKEQSQAALFQAVQQSIGILEVEPDGKIIQVNDTLAHYLNYAPHDLRGQFNEKIIKQDKGYTSFWQQLQAGKASQTSLQLQHKRSDVSTLAVAGNPVAGQDTIMLLFWIESPIEVV
ncbi:GAF domain-containing protein [Tunicatimonas pelagia]|uniref:GAF domain-containing protein n=1 Tax=Tunicatimonas pelagia TaxID=931531 RepID=UPI0026653283|nr:GAF domain-containing protein [Tunicatimonas pelagia]WKN45592.1 GAF domain-containing protein [Tunicatimonas pelagia]